MPQLLSTLWERRYIFMQDALAAPGVIVTPTMMLNDARQKTRPHRLKIVLVEMHLRIKVGFAWRNRLSFLQRRRQFESFGRLMAFTRDEFLILSAKPLDDVVEDWSEENSE